MNQENLNDTEINSLESNNSLNSESKNENGLLGALSKCLTFAPLMLEQFTGQKVPQMTGTMAEIQHGVNQLTTNLQVVINNQTKIWQKLVNLENNANQKLFNLVNKVDRLSGLKLTHKQETRQIELGTNQEKLTEY